jgi:hypothetical protein
LRSLAGMMVDGYKPRWIVETAFGHEEHEGHEERLFSFVNFVMKKKTKAEISILLLLNDTTSSFAFLCAFASLREKRRFMELCRKRS